MSKRIYVPPQRPNSGIYCEVAGFIIIDLFLNYYQMNCQGRYKVQSLPYVIQVHNTTAGRDFFRSFFPPILREMEIKPAESRESR